MNLRSRALCLLVGAASAAVALSSRAPVRAGDKAAGDETAVAARRQLVGEWKLNPELSEDPLAKMRQARGEGGHPGGGGGGGGGGGRGGHHGGQGGGYGGSGGEGAPRAEGEGPARSMMFTASEITVTNIEPEVTILDPEGQIRRLQADDKGYKDEAGTEVKARWEADRLVVETKGERGGTKEIWTVGADPRRLTVVLEIKRSYGGEVTVKRVFDPVPKS